ncbi:UDP-glucose/GDP-mannose dehydrogenase family protein [Paenibacillus sp. SI8]|uniref:UDP-glucose 6-dehydrogenase TuaD n=1 Tax=unclassified Paenibacillus TaxID=185978 RepID=UPI003466E79F
MRKIAVLGTGYVGLVSGACFAEIGNEVICCDVDERKIENLKLGKLPIYEPGLEDLVARNYENKRLSFTTEIAAAIQNSDIIYIAVGTPMASDGSADLRYVRSAAQLIGENLNGYKVIVNKSTVPVGTGKMVEDIIQELVSDRAIRFDVVSNPEFLREGTAIRDCLNMERAVIGAKSQEAAQIITDLHGPYNTTIIVTSIETAEMIKYAANAFLATKISFINDIANICEKVGADVKQLSHAIGLDSRIGSKFLHAGLGFGGSCFPKDTGALVHIAETVGYDFTLIHSVVETNSRQPLNFVQKINDALNGLQGKTIAILGLAFKPNTNDMRSAPSIKVIQELLKNNASVRAFDPIAIDEAKEIFGDSILYSTDLYETLKNCDACAILTEWNEVVHMDLSKVKEELLAPIIIDGRNLFDLDFMKEKGFTYHSIGRPSVYATERFVIHE